MVALQADALQQQARRARKRHHPSRTAAPVVARQHDISAISAYRYKDHDISVDENDEQKTSILPDLTPAEALRKCSDYFFRGTRRSSFEWDEEGAAVNNAAWILVSTMIENGHTGLRGCPYKLVELRREVQKAVNLEDPFCVDVLMLGILVCEFSAWRNNMASAYTGVEHLVNTIMDVDNDDGADYDSMCLLCRVWQKHILEASLVLSLRFMSYRSSHSKSISPSDGEIRSCGGA